MKKVRGIRKGLETKTASILGSNVLRNSRPESRQSPFEDANIELTFNLLKMRPKEEVRGQTNSAFFETLSCASRLNQNQSSKPSKPASERSNDSATPSLEAAYNNYDHAPYSDPGLPLKFKAAPHFGSMSVTSNPFTISDPGALVPKLDTQQLGMS